MCSRLSRADLQLHLLLPYSFFSILLPLSLSLSLLFSKVPKSERPDVNEKRSDLLKLQGTAVTHNLFFYYYYYFNSLIIR